MPRLQRELRALANGAEEQQGIVDRQHCPGELVLGSAGALAVIGAFPWLPVLIIAAREIGISVYRSYWARRGLAIPARRLAKLKTVVQEFAIAFALVPPIDEHARWFPLTLLWAAVALTVYTGAGYVLDGQRALTTGGSRS